MQPTEDSKTIKEFEDAISKKLTTTSINTLTVVEEIMNLPITAEKKLKIIEVLLG